VGGSEPQRARGGTGRGFDEIGSEAKRRPAERLGVLGGDHFQLRSKAQPGQRSSIKNRSVIRRIRQEYGLERPPARLATTRKAQEHEIGYRLGSVQFDGSTPAVHSRWAYESQLDVTDPG